jgi:tripartite ATP-independent transporter DctM subunit
MEWYFVLMIIFGGLIVMMATGLPVAFCFLFINVVGAILLWGGQTGLQQVAVSALSSVANFVYLPVPMFILLAEFIFRSGVATSAIDVIDQWLGRLPGRLALLAVVVSTILAALSGSSLASVAMLGATLTPEMERRGYGKQLSIGSVIGSSGLASLIPPSLMAVLLASIGEISIGKLLIAGVIPGVLIAAFYVSYIIIRCRLQPSIAPAYEFSSVPITQKVLATAKYVLPLAFVVMAVTGLIIIGVATPSESAAMGALAAGLLTAAYGKMTWKLIKKSIDETFRTTIMIFMIVAGSQAFSQILSFTGATQQLVLIIKDLSLPPTQLIAAMIIVWLFLGMFISALPMMMITLPIFMPLVRAFSLDPVWFGLLFMIAIDIGDVTPPFGLRLFVMRGVSPPEVTMLDIIKASLPFLGLELLAVALIVAFPALALWLPKLIR